MGSVIKRNGLLVNFPVQVNRADTFLSRFFGLMFQKSLPSDKGVLLLPCNSIHTCFMRFPIDVVFVDKGFRVIKTIRELLPWSIIFPIREAYATLELATGTINKFELDLGDQIQFDC